jgi:chitinase
VTLTSRISWEYPNRQGVGCNTISKNDTANFYEFLAELRSSVGDGIILTAAVPITPWTDASGNAYNMTGFAEVLNWAAIMNYDIWGSWSSAVGPNAPLNDTCAAPANQQGSAVSAVQAWMGAGFPKKQLVLGVPAYGHSYLVDKLVAFTELGELFAYPPFEPEQPKGDSSDGPSVDVCGVRSNVSGIYDFWGLVEGGFLDGSGQPLQGIHYRYDECSQTVRVWRGRFPSTAGLTEGLCVISRMSTTKPRKSWFRLMMGGRSRPREGLSRTLVCWDSPFGRPPGTTTTSS